MDDLAVNRTIIQSHPAVHSPFNRQSKPIAHISIVVKILYPAVVVYLNDYKSRARFVQRGPEDNVQLVVQFFFFLILSIV